MDTALYVLKENEIQENLQLVGFTEQQNKEVRCFCYIPILFFISSMYLFLLYGSPHMLARNSKLYLIRLKKREAMLFCACSFSKWTEFTQGIM